MLRRLLLVITFVFSANFASAQSNCAVINTANQAAESAFRDLLQNYPGTVLFYGVSGAAISESNPERLEQVAGGLAAAFIACSIVIDMKSCDFVAGRLTSILLARAAICAADRQNDCRICR